jgi:hypothetical protein
MGIGGLAGGHTSIRPFFGDAYRCVCGPLDWREKIKNAQSKKIIMTYVRFGCS